MRGAMLTRSWDNVCVHRNIRTGDWDSVKISLNKNNNLLVHQQNQSSENKTKKIKFKLNDYKVEVGKKEKLYCLFLISGCVKEIFGFENLQHLEVIDLIFEA